MVTRIGGLASGMDIDSIVEKLMQAERSPLNKLQQKKQTYEWQRDAYRNVNTKIKTLDTYIADNLVLKSFTSKKATSSNSSLVSSIATGSATGTLSIEGVSQLASVARAVGNQVSAVGSTKMSDLIGSGTKFIQLKGIKSDGTMPAEFTKIDITEGMTVDQFVSRVNASNAGVSAIFENGRFSFTAKNTGDNKNGDEIQISDSSKAIVENLGFFKDEEGRTTTKFQTDEGKNAIFQINGIASERSSNSFTISGYQLTLNETFNSKQTFADKYKAAQIEKELADTNLTDNEDALNTAKIKYYGTGASIYPNYSAEHNNAYSTAFGSGTLTLSQQEQYAKLSKSDWRNLTEAERAFVSSISSSSADDIKTAFDSSSLSAEAKNRLKKLSADKLEALKNVTSSDFAVYNLQTKLETYGGTKLKDLTTAAIISFKALTINETTELSAIHSNIDGNTAFSDDLKATLKSLDKVTLENLHDLTDAELGALAAKATEYESSNKLKSTYNSLGDNVISQLSTTTVDSNAMTTEQKKAWNALTSEQQTAWSALSSTERSNFVNLANKNIDRAAYKKAEANAKAAIARSETANATFETAEADARKESILKDDGTIDKTKLAGGGSTPAVTMSSTTNIDDMVTKVKDFITTYNGFVKDLADSTKESKYRDYAPLTSEQRKDMKEDEIKLWEEKAKSGLLRNDSIIRNGLSNMRSLIYQSNPAIEDKRFNTLFSIGITTSANYNDGGTLQIDETKLRKALEENPDAVEQLLKSTTGKKDDVVDGEKVDTRGYFEKLRESMKSLEVNIEKKAGRSTMTDAQYTIGKSLLDMETRIKSWQDKLESIESRYWKQFTAMESAINKSNQQSSLFTQ